MAYNHVELKNFVGLYLQRNSFAVPDGALEEAENCVINLDGVISKRRGSYTFASASAGTFNNLFLYQNNLLAAYNNKVRRIDSAGTQTTLGGETVAITDPRVTRNVQANDNLYFTSDNGVMKLEAYNSNVFKSGVAPGLDLTGKFAAANGPIESDCQVAYRILFGRRDANKNLLLSAPSDTLVLTNRPVTGATYTSSGAGPYTVTVTTASPHNLSTGMAVTTSGAVDTDANGPQTITVTSATTFTYSTVADPASGTINYAVTRAVSLEFSVPEDINSTEYFYQIYRSSQSADADTTPFADFKFIKEAQLTSAQLSANLVFALDDVLVIFEGAELYTNPNSREGELQANDRPPLCEDMCLFKNHTMYANTKQRHFINVDLISTSASILTASDYIEVKQGATTRRYLPLGGVGNSTVPSESVSGTTNITVTYTAHGFSTGDVILVSNIVGTITQGEYTLTGVTANTFDFTVTIGQTATSLDFEGVRASGTGYYYFQLVPPGSSPATGLDQTARGIVKAINTDASSAVYARYISGVTDVPGRMLLFSKTFDSNAIQLRANTTLAGTAFNPALPSSFGTTVQSEQDVQPNAVYISKVSEPEAVPLTNYILVGSRNKQILRIFALRDSVIVLKEDGVFRIDGDAVTNFTATILDGTVICVSAKSATVINNQVIFLSNQCVCLVSGTSVQIVSRKIEAPIAAVLGSSNLVTYTSGVSYESERLYLLTTLAPNGTTAGVVYVYNTLTDAWTTWDTFFKQGLVGPNDTLYLIDFNDKILKERKNANRLDYTAESYAATCVSVASDGLSGVFTSSLSTPVAGDVFVYNNIISRIQSVTAAGSDFAVVFSSVTNITAAASVVLYKKFDATVKMSPFHAGAIDRHKQFAQLQIHTKGPDITEIDITFAGDTFGSSESTTWRSNTLASTGGWGSLPFGYFPWGLDQGINLTYATQPAPPIRTYVPLFAQRGTFIQTILEHKMGAEPMNIQALGFAVRGYGERVSR